MLGKLVGVPRRGGQMRKETFLSAIKSFYLLTRSLSCFFCKKNLHIFSSLNIDSVERRKSGYISTKQGSYACVVLHQNNFRIKTDTTRKNYLHHELCAKTKLRSFILMNVVIFFSWDFVYYFLFLQDLSITYKLRKAKSLGNNTSGYKHI